MTTNLDLIDLSEKNNIPLDYIVYKDELHKIAYKPGLSIILNMSSTRHKGTHWISLYTTKAKVFYFDSFGEVPPIEVEQWAVNNSIKEVVYNNFQIQHLTDIDCGQLSLLFLHKVSLLIKRM